MYFVSIFAFIFMTNFIPTDQIDQAQQGQLSGIFGNMTFLTGEFFPHTLLLKGMHGNIYFGLLSILISVLIIVLIYGVSTKLDFVTSRKKSKKKEQKIKLTGGMPVLKKDLKLLQRDSQSLFLILYPLLFPLIFIFINVQSMAAMNIMFIFIGSMYAAILSVGMMVNDMKIWPIPKTYPIKTEQIINNKISIPLIIFLTEYVIITIISAALGYTNIIDYFMVIPVGLLLYYAALYGVKTYLKNPQRDTSNKNNVLTFKETIVFEGIIMGFGAAIFGLLTVYKINMQTPFLDWSTILINLVFVGIPILCMGLLIFLIKKQKEQIKKYSNEI
jgi:ABC-2 type transport system permease protein